MNKFLIPLAMSMILLTSCSNVLNKPADTQPYLNGLPVSAIYFDDAEEPVGYGKYHAFLIVLSNNQFVIWRNRDKVDFVLSNIEKYGAEYPTTNNPVRFTRNENLISGSKVFDRLKSKGFIPHIHRTEYEGEFQGEFLHLKSISSYIYPDGQEENPEKIVWNFRKLREY